MTGCLESSDCLLPPAPASFPCRLPPCFSVCLRRKRCRDGLFEVGGCVLVVADEVCDETALAVEDEGLRDAVVGGEEELDGLVVGVCDAPARSQAVAQAISAASASAAAGRRALSASGILSRMSARLLRARRRYFTRRRGRGARRNGSGAGQAVGVVVRGRGILLAV